MSIHGICFDNGQSGNCNADCGQFLCGECDVGPEIAEDLFFQLTPDEITEKLEASIEPVKLFTLRGSGSSDLELFIEALGY